jgi:hypothetical protein
MIYFLNETQKENRKFIIMANNPTAETYKGALTLNKVLISICEIYSKIEHSPLIDIIYIYHYCGQEKIKWDLTKETLEEQSEETQRGINKLLTKIK